MKQETLYRITSLITISLILLTFCFVIYSAKITEGSINSCLNKIDTLQRQIEGYALKIDNINIDKELLEKIDELTRQNTVLLQEVADQAKQIKEFGWLKEANKNIK